MNADADNPFANLHRGRRAQQLAEAIRAFYASPEFAGVTRGETVAELAARMRDVDWAMVADIAGIRPPDSDSPTRQIVVGMLSAPENALLKGLGGLTCR